MNGAQTIELATTSSGKTHSDENFPVASLLIAPALRAPILAFYDFVRAADDVADNAALAPEHKLALLDRLESALLGEGPDEPVARRLREALNGRGLSPRHAQDLLRAFRRDVTELRYRDWDDLIDYCRYSAMPVGRFVLDLHGEDPERTWALNDALCAALQINNHLQDCGKDYRSLDRVYLPQDFLAAESAEIAMLGEERAPPPLRAAIAAIARRNAELLASARPFAGRIADLRLALEVGAIHRVAEYLAARLAVADPLSEKVHAAKAQFLALAAAGAVSTLLLRSVARAGGAA
ncbi:MAG TPA: squalene synthase HpnC [Methylocystis sp.]|nr:squalene synthase HpnC [Methylocystis sp.]